MSNKVEVEIANNATGERHVALYDEGDQVTAPMLEPGTYTFRLRTFDPAGETPWSGWATFNAQGEPENAPAPPDPMPVILDEARQAEPPALPTFDDLRDALQS